MVFLRRQTAAEAVTEAKRLLFEGTQEERLAFTESAVSRFPDHAGVRLEFAYALRVGEDQRARSEALKSIELERSGDTMLLARAADLLFGLGDVQAARECVERARLAQPTNLVVMNKLNHVEGQIALADKDYAEAERLLRRAHDGDPADGFIAWDLAVVIASREGGSRHAEALAVIDETLLTAPQSSSSGARAGRYFSLGARPYRNWSGTPANGLAGRPIRRVRRQSHPPLSHPPTKLTERARRLPRLAVMWSKFVATSGVALRLRRCSRLASCLDGSSTRNTVRSLRGRPDYSPSMLRFASSTPRH